MDVDARPEIDMDRLHDILGTTTVEQTQPDDPPAKFCSVDCRLNYREDRIQGKQLPVHDPVISYKQLCANNGLCAYCLAPLEK